MPFDDLRPLGIDLPSQLVEQLLSSTKSALFLREPGFMTAHHLCRNLVGGKSFARTTLNYFGDKAV